MASETWIIFDNASGRKVATLNNVAPSVVLTGVAVTDGESTLTFAALATGVMVFPGMLIEAKGVPEGTTIKSVDGATTLTLSAAATATGAGLQANALSYIPRKADGTVDTLDLHLEHYRDEVNGTAQFVVGGVTPNNHTVWNSITTPNGAGFFIDDPTVQVWDTGATQGVIAASGLTGTPQVALDDKLTHTHPRPQHQTCSVVYFILDNGTRLPVIWLPNLQPMRAL